MGDAAPDLFRSRRRIPPVSRLREAELRSLHTEDVWESGPGYSARCLEPPGARGARSTTVRPCGFYAWYGAAPARRLGGHAGPRRGRRRPLGPDGAAPQRHARRARDGRGSGAAGVTHGAKRRSVLAAAAGLGVPAVPARRLKAGRARARRPHTAAAAPPQHHAEQARGARPARARPPRPRWPTATAAAPAGSCRAVSLARRLADRTLELVDMPQSRATRRPWPPTSSRVLRDGGVGGARRGRQLRAGRDDRPRRAPARAARRASGHRAGPGQPSRPCGGERRPRARQRRHEGRPGGDDRARAGTAGRRGRSRLRVLRARGAAAHRQRTGPAARARAGAARGGPRARHGAHRQRAAGRLPGQRQRDLDLPRRLGALGAPVARRQRDPPRGRGHPVLAQVAPAPVEFDGLRFTEVVSVTGVRAGSRATSCPPGPRALVNYRYAPGRSAADAEAWPARAVRAVRDAGDRRHRPERTRAPWPTRSSQRLVATGGLAVEPKQAWTPVAEFARPGSTR